MVKYEKIINIISIVLLLTILVVVLFGCHYGGCRSFNYEGFENNETSNEEEPKKEVKEEKEKKPEMTEKSEKKEQTDEEVKNSLTSFEKTVLEGLTSGSLTTNTLSDLIKAEKFTSVNLNNLINYVEHFRGVI